MTILPYHLQLDTKQLKEKKVKILTPKEILQRLPKAFAQINAGDKVYKMKSVKLYIICFEEKKLMKYYITVKPIQYIYNWKWMDVIFMNSENIRLLTS